jgi:glycosyltransferase involved in cell wall biosynthesis
VHFLGFVPDPRPYLHSADVFVLASRKDPFPLVIPEAREAGCAIVASNVDGIPEALEHGRAGLLVAPGDPQEIARAIARLLGNPEELAYFRMRARDNLDWLRLKRAAEETIAVYEDALGDRKLRPSSSPESRELDHVSYDGSRSKQLPG